MVISVNIDLFSWIKIHFALWNVISKILMEISFLICHLTRGTFLTNGSKNWDFSDLASLVLRITHSPTVGTEDNIERERSL